MTMFYFCWERGQHGRWQAVCYHDAPPRPEQVSQGDAPTRTPVITVPADMIGGDGQPLFGALAERYPPPAQKREKEVDAP